MSAAGHERARPTSASQAPRPNSTRSARSTPSTSRPSTSRGRRQGVTTVSIERASKPKTDSRELEEKYKALQQTREAAKREATEEERRKRREATSHQQLLSREHRVAEREFTRREQEMAKLEKSLQKVRNEEDKRNDRQHDFNLKMSETLARLEQRHKELEEELLEKVQEAAEAKGRLAHIEFAQMLQLQGNDNVHVRVERRVEYERITNGEGVDQAQPLQRLLDQEVQMQHFEDALRNEAEELRILNQRKEEMNEQLRQRLEEVEEWTRAESVANSQPGMSRSISWQAQDLHQDLAQEQPDQDAHVNQPQASDQEPHDDRAELRTPDSPVTAENWALAHTPPPPNAMSLTYPCGVTLYLPEFVPLMSKTSAQNAADRDRILQEIVRGYHMPLLLQICSVKGWDLHGGLSWSNGEIVTLVSMLFQDLGLAPPRDVEIYPIYAQFSADQIADLDMRECLCIADATLRAVFLQPQPEAPGALGPAWTHGEFERSADAREIGGWTQAGYSLDEQQRLGIDEMENPRGEASARQAPSSSGGNSSRLGGAEAANEQIFQAQAVLPGSGNSSRVGSAAANGLLSSYKSYEDLPGRPARTSTTASGPSSDAGTEQKLLRNVRSEPELHGARPPPSSMSVSMPSTVPAPPPAVQTMAVALEPNSPGVESGSSTSLNQQLPLAVVAARPASVLSARPAPQVRVVPASSPSSFSSVGVTPTVSPQLSGSARAGSSSFIRQVSPAPLRGHLPAPSPGRPSSLIAPAASAAPRWPARLTSTASTSPVRLAPSPQARGDVQFAPRLIRVPTVTNITADTPQRPVWMNETPQRATQVPAWMADPAMALPPTRRQMPATATMLPSSVAPTTPKLTASPRPLTVARPVRPIGREGSLPGPALSPGGMVTSPLVVRRLSHPRNASPAPGDDNNIAPQPLRQQPLPSETSGLLQPPQHRFAAPSPSPTASPIVGGSTSSRTPAHRVLESTTYDSQGTPMAQIGIDLNNDGVADFVITGPDLNHTGLPDAIDAALAARSGAQVDLGGLSSSVVSVSVAPPKDTSSARPADARVTPTTPAPWAWNAIDADASSQAAHKLFGAAPPMMPSTCVCGNVFMPDDIFCRRCGGKRPTLPTMTV